jgi:HTH-type transcriptional regulator/antitoxin HipB
MLVGSPFDIAICIRSRRRELKLGQADLARAAGVTRQWIVALERGHRPTLELGLVLRTIEALGMELALGWPSPPPAWTRPITAKVAAIDSARAAIREAKLIAKQADARRRRGERRLRAARARPAGPTGFEVAPQPEDEAAERRLEP